MSIDECRELLIEWWQGLSVDQKKIVPISRNKIDLRDLFINTEIEYFKLRGDLKKDILEIEKELKVLGVL
ncbi:hypothetical protein, partial [Vibrio sp. V22_P2S10T140]